MKNIHVLPTDKPSRLHLWFDEKGTRLETCELEYSHTRNTQHIYITNDEEIKEGDWCLHNGFLKKVLRIKYSGSIIVFNIGNGSIYGHEFEDAKKIILTTDQKLIADGVQAIDDEFLEWFVKNPNCESVELNGRLTVKENGIQELMKDEYYQKFTEELPNCVFINHYKIIIPKEESLSYEDFRKKASKELLEKFDNEASKRSGDGDFDNYFYGNCRYWENKLKEEPTRKTDTCYNFNKEIGCVQTDCRCEKEEHKQETLEEAANNYSSNELSKLGFINGTKWQTERSYSEEEALELLNNFNKHTLQLQKLKLDNSFNVKEWFEQFKKTIRYEKNTNIKRR